MAPLSVLWFVVSFFNLLIWSLALPPGSVSFNCQLFWASPWTLEVSFVLWYCLFWTRGVNIGYCLSRQLYFFSNKICINQFKKYQLLHVLSASLVGSFSKIRFVRVRLEICVYVTRSSAPRDTLAYSGIRATRTRRQEVDLAVVLLPSLISSVFFV